MCEFAQPPGVRRPSIIFDYKNIDPLSALFPRCVISIHNDNGIILLQLLVLECPFSECSVYRSLANQYQCFCLKL